MQWQLVHLAHWDDTKWTFYIFQMSMGALVYTNKWKKTTKDKIIQAHDEMITED